MTRYTTHARRGMSLVEVLVSSMLLSTLAIGALTTVGAVSMSRSRMNDRLKSYQLAEAMLAEVLQTHYDDPDDGGLLELPIPTGGGTRGQFTKLDDYHNWNARPPVDRDDQAIAGYAGWRRQVFVTNVKPADLSQSIVDTGLKKILVRVTDPAGKKLELVSLRSRHGANEQAPMQDSDVVCWVGVELQIGKSSPETISATNLVNHAHD